MKRLFAPTCLALSQALFAQTLSVDFDSTPGWGTVTMTGDWFQTSSNPISGGSGNCAFLPTPGVCDDVSQLYEGVIWVDLPSPMQVSQVQVLWRAQDQEDITSCTWLGLHSFSVINSMGDVGCFDLGGNTHTWCTVEEGVGLATVDWLTDRLGFGYSTGDGLFHDNGLWIDNILITIEAPDCDNDGIPDAAEIDCDANGTPDSCDIAADPSLDQDLNGILDACEQSGPLLVRYPPTGRLFTALGPATWAGAQSWSAAQGLSLATVEDADLDAWLRTTFDLPLYWIGYHDSGVEGVFEWASGRPSTYENWAPGAPNSFAADQDFTAVNRLTGQWDTHFSTSIFPAVLETNAVDCDADGTLDDAQIAQDPSLDCNGDGALDSCQIATNGALDCDGNGSLDQCEVLDPALDVNGDGLLDACVTPNYCEGAPNSSGSGASMQLLGTPEMALDDCTLHATGLPPLQWSYFVMSQGQAYVPNFGGSQGILCIGAPIVRLNLTAGPGQQIDQTTASGERSYQLDFGALPQGISFLAGETWNFQLWFRDVNPSLTSNTTDGISVMFR